MKNYCFLLLSGCMMFCFGCKQARYQTPEKGVSFSLNEERKKSIDSIHYEIELDIPAGKNERITGQEQISFVLKSQDRPVVLDFSADGKQLISVELSGEKISYTFENEHIIIDPRNLEEGKNTISIRFIAGDLSLNRSEEYLYTLFVPDRASTCFPLFDQPNLKATYSLTLKTPETWEAVSNGGLLSKTADGSRSIYKFGKTKPISSYLFAFAAGKFFKISESIEGRNMTMYYRETDSTKVARNRKDIFNLHAKALSWLEDYTSFSYPFEKFDFVLIPSFQYGGMEHPGSVFYNESALFLDENASVNKEMARASVIAHESAHMWFGDLVTMDWFNDVWLKEVFANFMAAKIVHPNFPRINHNLRFLLAHYPNAYEVDRTAGTNPILQDLENLKNAGTLYGAIIYMKAPIVMRQLEKKIGDMLMQESLREYLKTYAFGNARWDDLIGIIDKKTPLNIAEWSAVWVKTPGMPEYLVIGDSIQQKKDAVSGRIWQQKLVLGKIAVDSLLLNFPNSDGTGYGYFEMDSAAKSYFVRNYAQKKDTLLSNPVFRGSVLVSIWEGFLRGAGPQPDVLVSDILRTLPKEQNPLLVDYLLGNLQTAWWLFLTEESRMELQTDAENSLWGLLERTKDKGIKTSYFRAFKSIAQSPDGLVKMESLWDGKLEVKGLVLSEDDKISLAYELALKSPGNTKLILEEQLKNTKNPDRKAGMQFVVPALSADPAERDAFFQSLKKPENREKETWVLTALSYLHHPLRAASAIKYLRPSLNILQEIQLTGDIFFPGRWLHNTFAGHSSKEAAAVSKAFLSENPDYPYYLKNKIIQSTDMLDRAVELKR
ncbi:M1 family metallopeptidase [Dyadobacter bucti]|uniref:M1 family metallopeptidase n=1 Tax=Dyadobacter bucti TaxID=2572203 RepID=UPI003F6FC2B8